MCQASKLSESHHAHCTFQKVQPTTAGRQSDQAEGYYGSMGSSWQHRDHSSQQPDAEGVELHHRESRPCPDGM